MNSLSVKYLIAGARRLRNMVSTRRRPDSPIEPVIQAKLQGVDAKLRGHVEWVADAAETKTSRRLIGRGAFPKEFG